MSPNECKTSFYDVEKRTRVRLPFVGMKLYFFNEVGFILVWPICFMLVVGSSFTTYA